MNSLNSFKKKQWTSQEIQLLKEYYHQFSSKKWKKISQIFKENGYQRSQLDIRQRWINYEDPQLLFTQWTDEQLQNLYSAYKKFGSKWCFIKKAIIGRTQNKIKNKFYGNVRIFLRFVVNYFNKCKQDTMWIHKINPRILNDIYQGKQRFKDFGSLVEESIKQMGYKVDKIKLMILLQQNIRIYILFNQRVLELQNVLESKELKRERRKLNKANNSQESNDESQLKLQKINSKSIKTNQLKQIKQKTPIIQKIDINSQTNTQFQTMVPIYQTNFLAFPSNFNHSPMNYNTTQQYYNSQYFYHFLNYWSYN